PLLQQLGQAVEEFVAAGLGDVEEADRASIEGCRAVDALASSGRTLPRGVEHHTCTHDATSLVTGWLPVSPLIQPPMMAENIPAVPPACTNHRPSGPNLGHAAPPRASGIPSSQPPAPRTSSEPSIVSNASSSSRSRALDQPPSRNTRACSGDTTMKASKAIGSFGWATVRKAPANDRARDSGVLEAWSTTP